MKKTISKVGTAGIVALLALSSVPAFAADGARGSGEGSDPLYTSETYDSIVLHEEFNATSEVDVAGTKVKFTFTPVDPASDPTELGLAEVPANAKWGTNNMITLTTQKQTSDEQDIDLNLEFPDISAFSHAGVYAWTVKQVLDDGEAIYPIEPGAGTGLAFNSEKKDISVATAEYKIRLYVINDEVTGGLKYDTGRATVERITGNVEKGDEENIKVNPTPKTVTDQQTHETQTVPSQFYFVNNVLALRDLTIQNVTLGEYANISRKFPYHVVINLPDHVAQDATFIVKEGHASKNAFTLGNIAYADETVTAVNGVLEIDAELANGDYITIQDLPVGSSYTVENLEPKEGVNNYEHRADWTYSSASTNAGYFTKSTSNPTTPLTYNNTSGAAKIYSGVISEVPNENPAVGNGLTDTHLLFSNDSGNVMVITNTLENAPSPTGLLLEYGPYVILVGIAVVGGIALVIKRKKNAK